MYKVLHIAPHLGGGVGKTLLSYFSVKDSSFTHEVVILGYALDNVIKTSKNLGILLHVHMWEKQEKIVNMIPKFDIVVIHCWNHPLLYDFLVRNKLPPCRLMILAHNSGFYPPNIYTRKILAYPDLFVSTTPLSRNSSDVIWSTAGVKYLKPKKHKDFIVGYIGTVNYSKLRPAFLHLCNQINIPNIIFYIVGTVKNLKKRARKLGIGEKFVFTNFQKTVDVKKFLKKFDVFGYPLAKYHYGTCDLALQEAMGAGVVPVVFDNPMEKYMVKHMETGIVVKTEKEYIKAIESLYNNSDLRNRLSKNARRYAKHEFSLEKLASDWKKVFSKVLKFPKTSKKWDINKSEITYKDVFLESLGHYGEAFAFDSIERIKELTKLNTWQPETKGTVHNYNFYFPNDPYLSKWSKLMKKCLK